MADTESTNRPNAEAESTAVTPPGPSMSARLKLLGMVLAVVAVECIVATLWLPNVSDSQAKAAAGIDEVGGILTENLMEDETTPQVEVDLGEFMVTAYQPVSSTTMRIDFHLYGVVFQSDNAEFLRLKEASDARLREQISAIVRAASVSDLTDPGLGLIKRRILEKTNRLIGKPLLRGIIFSDFSCMEQ